MEGSSSTSSISHEWRYDVFLSFRGDDTRDNIISHLRQALDRENVKIFIDDTLTRGEEIAPSLLTAIEESKISLIIFSQDYANSAWCLDELVKILECRRTKGQIAIPVFYKVDPSYVSSQLSSFWASFGKHKRGFDRERLKTWRQALDEAAHLSGWDSQCIRTEAMLVKKIVADVLRKLNQMSQSPSTCLVAIDSRTKEIQSLLQMKSHGTCFTGIWGMGGAGKTSLARAVYNEIYSDFEGHYFLPNIGDQLKKHTIVDLRKILLSKLLDEEDVDVGAPGLELTFINDRLCRKRILLVLDDVDDLLQLRELLGGNPDTFGKGSKIIITSRDKQLLENLDGVYEVKELNNDEALQLFCFHAFKTKSPADDYIEISKQMVNYSGGNPLAVTALGSELRNRSKKDWESALQKLQKFPNSIVQNRLRSSYDRLDLQEKKIFLAICCCFIGYTRDFVTKVLDHLFSSTHYSISCLINKSLVTVCEDELIMHNLIEKMGRAIVCEESTDPGKRSWLWDHEDISDVLINKKGTKAIEGICLDLSQVEEMNLKSDALSGMSNLRFLIFNGDSSQLCFRKPEDGLLFLPNKLLFLIWHFLPSKTLPSSFSAECLVELDLSYSKIEQLWKGVKRLVNLTRIVLNDCVYLIEIPDLSMAKNIESLCVQGCERLTELHSSIQCLYKLTSLQAKGCKHLSSVPSKLESRCIKTVDLCYCPELKICPEMNWHVMKYLGLKGTAVREVPCSLGLIDAFNITIDCTFVFNFLLCIEELCLNETAVKEVPPAIVNLERLSTLEMKNCKELLSLPDSICRLRSLIKLYLTGCNSLRVLPELPASLRVLEADGCTQLRHLLSSRIREWKFIKLSFSNCIALEEQYKKNFINALYTFDHLMPKEIEDNGGQVNILYPGSNIPAWFRDRVRGSRLRITLSLDMYNLCGVAFCAVLNSDAGSYRIKDLVWHWYLDENTFASKKCSIDGLNLLESDHVLVSYFPCKGRAEDDRMNAITRHSYCTVIFKCDVHTCIVKSFGVRFVWDLSIRVKPKA